MIEVVGSTGTPPEWGFQFFSAGLEPYLKVLEEDYLKTFIRDGGASFKVVIGAYGGGKTHFLYSVRELAWRHQYVVAYCPLSHDSSPFHRLELVYKAIAANLMRPLSSEELMSGAERGIGPFIKSVFAEMVDALEQEGVKRKEQRVRSVAAEVVRGMENPNFGQAVRVALEALIDRNPDEFERTIQYLSLSGYDRIQHRRMGILQEIGRGQAFSAIRSLVNFVRNLRFKGLVILFDEAEQAGAMTSRQKEMMLANLREMVDQCGAAAFANVMIFYAIPSEHFLTEGRSPAYEALRQRIQTVFDFTNPTGVKIRLDRLTREPESLMREIGEKLSNVYETAYGFSLPFEDRNKLIRTLSSVVAEHAFGDIGYKRLFVQAMVRALHTLRHSSAITLDEDFIRKMVRPEEVL